MAREASIKNLTNAKRAKNDEFYTQYIDIQKEIERYLDFTSFQSSSYQVHYFR